MKMCLAVPGKVIEIFEENGLKMGKIDYSGTLNRACLAYVPEVEVGQYVIVHAGFAIQVLDEKEAQQVFEAFDEMTDALRREGYSVSGEPLARKNHSKDGDASDSVKGKTL